MLISHRLTARDVASLEKHRVYLMPDGSPRLRVGDAIQFSPNAVIEPYVGMFSGPLLPTMGSFSYTWSGFAPFDMDIKIGRYCSISGHLSVFPGNHAMEFASHSSFTGDKDLAPFRAALADYQDAEFVHRYPEVDLRRWQPPVIGNDVLIGMGVTLARGITLGDGCVVGASSVVTRDVPPYAIVGGNPAQVIRMRFSDKIIEGLQALQWWRYAFPDFGSMRYDEPERFIGELGERIAAGNIRVLADSRPISALFEQR